MAYRRPRQPRKDFRPRRLQLLQPTVHRIHIAEHPSKMLSSLQALRAKQKFCDVIITVGAKTFHGHRAVLASSSPYFEAMFSSGLMEEQQHTVEIHGVQEGILSQLLDFIYIGTIEINQENVQDMLAAANMLELSEIVNSCCNFLRKELHPSNCVGIYRFAELHSCVNLRLEAKRYIERCFTEVIQEEEFYDLPIEVVRNFLRSEGLHIDNEFQVLQAGVRWLLRDPVQRCHEVFELIGFVRLPLISEKQLEICIKECSDVAVRMALMEVFQEHRNKMHLQKVERTSPSYDIRHQPRMCARKSVYVLGGYNRGSGRRWSDTRTLLTVEKLDSQKSRWKSLPAMQFSRSGHGVAVLNGTIYVMGGESDCMIFDNGEAFDPLSNCWTAIQSMIQPRSVAGACALDGYIYALGGWVGAEIGDTVERYDPSTDTWTQSVKMRTPRYAMGVVSNQGLIYVLGGLSEISTELDLVESFNPETKEWSSLSPMLIRRAYLGVAVLFDHIYAVGGTNNHHLTLNSVERYSIEENKWTQVAPMKTARAGACVAAVNGKLLVIGGRSGGDDFAAPITLDSVEVYNPETNKWTELPPMPTSRCEAGVAVL